MKKRRVILLGSLIGFTILTNDLSAGSDINSTQEILTPSSKFSTDFYETTVDISDKYAILGTYADSDNKGSAYLFDINKTQIKLSANDGSSNDYFGYSVSIDNNYTIIGAKGDDSDTGSAYLFNLSGTDTNSSDINPTQIKLTAKDGVSSDSFGFSVAIEGNYTIVGAKGDNSNIGSAYLFNLNGTDTNSSDVNTTQIKLTARDGVSDDYFGYSVAINSKYVAVGAVNINGGKGSVYIFDLNGTDTNSSDINATQIKLTPMDSDANDDAFATSIAMSDNYLIVGTYNGDISSSITNSGSGYLFNLNGTDTNSSDINATQIKLTAKDGAKNDHFGASVAINNKYAVAGAFFNDDGGSNRGSGYLFNLSGTDTNSSDINATQTKLTVNGSSNLGASMGISNNYLIIRDSSYAYRFNLIPNNLPTASNVAISGSVDIGEVLTGSYDYSDSDNDSESGTTYKWYRADDNSGTSASAISGATSKSYTITAFDSGKYLAFEVTPNDGKSNGSAVKSSYSAMVPIKMDFNSSMIRVNSWNMITVPDEINVSVSNINGATIWTFNNTTNAWENPTTLTAGKGYILYTSSSIGLVSAQKVASTITDDNTTIKNGNSNSWTLVGISKSTSGFSWKEIYTPTNTLKTGCAYTQVFYYDSVNSTWNTTTNIPYLGAIWVKQNCFGD